MAFNEKPLVNSIVKDIAKRYATSDSGFSHAEKQGEFWWFFKVGKEGTSAKIWAEKGSLRCFEIPSELAFEMQSDFNSSYQKVVTPAYEKYIKAIAQQKTAKYFK